MPANVEAKIEFLDKQIYSRETWLDTHSKKFPEHLVETKTEGLEMFIAIRDDYTQSLERAKQREAERDE